MAFKCLSQDRQLECLLEKGFQCAAVGEPSRKSYSCHLTVDDECFRTRFQLKRNGWSGSDKWLTGMCVDTHEPVLEPGVRWMYDNTNAPDELVFKLFVGAVFGEALSYIDDLDALSDEPYHAGYHYVSAGLTGKMESVDVVRYFAQRYLAIEAEVEELSRSLLCDGKSPRYKGTENIYILNQLDDVRLHVYERHLFLARADLQASGLFDLDKALLEIPMGFSSVSIEHRAAPDGSIAGILEGASRLCEEPWGISITSSRPPSDNKIE